jgi:hypothetical protein
MFRALIRPTLSTSLIPNNFQKHTAPFLSALIIFGLALTRACLSLFTSKAEKKFLTSFFSNFT